MIAQNFAPVRWVIRDKSLDSIQHSSVKQWSRPEEEDISDAGIGGVIRW